MFVQGLELAYMRSNTYLYRLIGNAQLKITV